MKPSQKGAGSKEPGTAGEGVDKGSGRAGGKARAQSG